MKDYKEHTQRLTEWKLKFESKTYLSSVEELIFQSLEKSLKFLNSPSFMDFQQVVNRTSEISLFLADLGVYPELSEIFMSLYVDMLMEPMSAKDWIQIWLKEQETTRKATGIIDAQFSTKRYEDLSNYISLTKCYIKVSNICPGYVGWLPENWSFETLIANLILVPTDINNPRYAIKLVDSSIKILETFEKSPRITLLSTRLKEFWDYIEILPLAKIVEKDKANENINAC